MSKWKCEICNSEFENFQAQGFNNKIYCPLCYYKELYRRTELERERLKNIINELEKFVRTQLKVAEENIKSSQQWLEIEEEKEHAKHDIHTGKIVRRYMQEILKQLKELKEENK